MLNFLIFVFNKKREFQKFRIKEFYEIFQINFTYPNFEIFQELILTKRELFTVLTNPSQLDSLNFFISKFGNSCLIVALEKIDSGLTNTYREILTFSLTQLAKVIFFSARILDIFLPIKMKIYKNLISFVCEFSSNEEFFLILSKTEDEIFPNLIDSNKLEKDQIDKFSMKMTENALTFLFINFFYLCNSVGLNTSDYEKNILDFNKFYYFEKKFGFFKKSFENPVFRTQNFYFDFIKIKYEENFEIWQNQEKFHCISEEDENSPSFEESFELLTKENL